MRRVQLWEDVAAELRRSILLGELTPGAHLIETELAESLRVSRGPVREALRQLELETLVESRPNGRTLVVGLTRSRIGQLYDARTCLESHALELAAANATGEDIDRMGALLDGMLGAREDGRENLVTDLDLAFHRGFFAVAGNRVLGNLWEALTPQIRTLLDITNVVNPHLPSINEKHQRILRALAEHDPAGAREALASHLEEAQDVLLQRMEQRRLVTPAEDAAAADGRR